MSTLLSSALRSNLNSANLLSAQIAKTQERVSTGRKVNSAADDAYAYFSEKSMRKTSDKLDKIFQEMDTGSKTIDAAISSLNSISDLVNRTESLVRSAQETSNFAERIGLRKQVSDLMKSIQQMAENASYRGVNLLGDSSNELNIGLNADGSDTLDISAATSADDSFTDLSGSAFGFEMTALSTDGMFLEASASNDLISADSELVADLGYTAADTIDFSGATSGASFSYAITATSTVKDLVDAVNADGNFKAVLNSDNTISYSSATYESITVADSAAATNVSIVNGDTSAAIQSVTGTVDYFTVDASLDDMLNTLSNFKTTIQAKEGSLSNYSVILDAHQNLTENMMSLLQENADNLVVANIEEESVSLNVLQTRQQLAMISISMATQQEQNIMRLF